MDGNKMADDDRSMMMHGLKTGKTNLMGESKANQTSKPPKTRAVFHKRSISQVINHKIR